MGRLSRVFAVRFRVDRPVVYAFCLGIASVVCSILLNILSSYWTFLIFRDLLQIVIIGLVLPFFLMSREGMSFHEAGLRFDSWHLFLGISCVLGGLLLLQFYFEDAGKIGGVGYEALEPALYVMAANVFEVLFFVVYLRSRFERAFGIIPAILLASVFFSLHHAGFQPEFMKLFFVGVFFMVIFRIVHHWLVLFPLWWVGGVWDVLVKSDAVSDMSWIAWWNAAYILAAVLLMLALTKPWNESIA